jgi:hypothetical protein
MSLPAAAAMVVEAWRDLDRALDGLSSGDAERRLGGASPISWTVAHLAENVDRLLNDQFLGEERNVFLNVGPFKFGAPGDPADWETVLQEAQKVRETCRRHLEGLSESDLERRAPYEGSSAAIREATEKAGGISLRYALIRVALHHYFHIGEIASARRAAGHQVGDFPGMLEACL